MIQFCILTLVVSAVSSRSLEEGQLMEGDMDLNPDQLNAYFEQIADQNSFASIKAGLWMTNGKVDTIQYYIDSSILGPSVGNAKPFILKAIADYERMTCLKFKEVSVKPTGPHLHFTNGTGYYSCCVPYIDFNGLAQSVNVQAAIFRGFT